VEQMVRGPQQQKRTTFGLFLVTPQCDRLLTPRPSSLWFAVQQSLRAVTRQTPRLNKYPLSIQKKRRKNEGFHRNTHTHDDITASQ